LSNNSNWCPEIYRTVFVNRFNNDQLYVSPCCQAIGKLEPSDNFDFYTSPTLVNFRKQFDAGDFPKECNRCWQMEKHGHKSRRQSAIEFFDLPTEDRTVVFEGFDYSGTWACNLACIMCSPTFSSTWANELSLSKSELAKIGKLFQKSNNFLERVDVRSLKKLHFNGGEPLLNNDHLSVLEKLNDNDMLKNIFISYNTNATIAPSPRLIELWSQARLVKIFFSIDATDTAFEYIRWPAKWDQAQDNMLSLKQSLSDNVMFGINATVGCYNIFEIKHVWEWFLKNIRTNNSGDESNFCWQMANNYNIGDLSGIAKQAAIDYIGSIPELQGIVSFLHASTDCSQSDQWITKLNELDSRRGNSWRNSLHVAQYY
jgi:sulfatase maturation enzyme AslB (radical SAM superfamily)